MQGSIIFQLKVCVTWTRLKMVLGKCFSSPYLVFLGANIGCWTICVQCNNVCSVGKRETISCLTLANTLALVLSWSIRNNIVVCCCVTNRFDRLWDDPTNCLIYLFTFSFLFFHLYFTLYLNTLLFHVLFENPIRM